MGDLLQELLSIAGNAINLYINNGGGIWASVILLCGLGDKCMLVLVDGICLAYNDVNAIFSSMIECIEVLSDGVFVVYGFYVIGGVVNFILCLCFDGV